MGVGDMNNPLDILSFLAKSPIPVSILDIKLPTEDQLSIETPDAFESAIKKAVREMDAYNAAHPAGAALPTEEKARYEKNREFIKKTAKLNRFGNLVMLEIWERGQWRIEFQNVEDFAWKVAELSKSQFYKCLDDARILRRFELAGIGCAPPRGRLVEEICKVPEEHHVAAWIYAQEVTKDSSLTQESAKVAFRDYCRDHQLTHGRRETNPPAMDRGVSAPESAVAELVCKDPEAAVESEPVSELLPLGAEEEKILTRAVSPAVSKRIEKCFPTKKPHEVILYNLLTNYPEARFSPDDRTGLVELLKLLQARHPKIVEEVILGALKHIRGTVEATVVKYCKKNTDSKKAYQKKKKLQTVHTTQTAGVGVTFFFEKSQTESKESAFQPEFRSWS